MKIFLFMPCATDCLQDYIMVKFKDTTTFVFVLIYLTYFYNFKTSVVCSLTLCKSWSSFASDVPKEGIICFN